MRDLTRDFAEVFGKRKMRRRVRAGNHISKSRCGVPGFTDGSKLGHPPKDGSPGGPPRCPNARHLGHPASRLNQSFLGVGTHISKSRCGALGMQPSNARILQMPVRHMVEPGK